MGLSRACCGRRDGEKSCVFRKGDEHRGQQHGGQNKSRSSFQEVTVRSSSAIIFFGGRYFFR